MGRGKARPGPCPDCGDVDKNLHLHQYLHHQVKYHDLVCPRCDLAFYPIDKNLLKTHLRSCHPCLPSDEVVQRYGREVPKGYMTLIRCTEKGACDFKAQKSLSAIKWPSIVLERMLYQLLIDQLKPLRFLLTWKLSPQPPS
jgi:hypothetical protein